MLGVYFLATVGSDRGTLGCAALVGLLLLEDDRRRVKTAFAVAGAIFGLAGTVLGWVAALA